MIIYYYIQSYFIKNKEFVVENLWKYFKLNLVLIGIIFIISIIAGLLIYNAKIDLELIITLITIIPYFLFIFLLLSISYPIFTNTLKIKKTIKKTFSYFKKLKTYLALIQTIILLFIITIPYNVMSTLSFGNLSSSTIYIFAILIYIIYFINRVNFYKITSD
tara:strand:+ start:2288 stop:2773 length:486 start_codon:yes stop_codon:yes gene_type:complete